jgi:hypothetical protein
MEEFPVTREQAVLVGEHVSAEELPPPPGDGEPLWDTPVVAEPSTAALPSLEASDLSEVWNQRKSPLDGIDWKSLEEQPKQPGFFARLFSRKKKEEFVVADEESFGDLTAREPAAADFAPDLFVPPPSDSDFVEEAPPPLQFIPPVEDIPVVAAEDLGDTVPVPMPAVPRPTPIPPAKVEEFETTQPFTPFRDARDDFADEDATSTARATGQVPAPAMDEDEKTDEFDLVPMPTPMGATAETRMVPGFFGRMFGRKAEASAPTAGDIPATSAADDKIPFVLAKFRSFYNEVIRDKHQKSDVISGFATALMGAGGATSESDPEFAAQLLSKRLSEMLELQAAESNWTGGDAAKYYPEAQYAMVALADETFATIDWPGRSAWHKYMLEPRMYGTRGADIEFFKRIDRRERRAGPGASLPHGHRVGIPREVPRAESPSSARGVSSSPVRIQPSDGSARALRARSQGIPPGGRPYAREPLGGQVHTSTEVGRRRARARRALHRGLALRVDHRVGRFA